MTFIGFTMCIGKTFSKHIGSTTSVGFVDFWFALMDSRRYQYIWQIPQDNIKSFSQRNKDVLHRQGRVVLCQHSCCCTASNQLTLHFQNTLFHQHFFLLQSNKNLKQTLKKGPRTKKNQIEKWSLCGTALIPFQLTFIWLNGNPHILF